MVNTLPLRDGLVDLDRPAALRGGVQIPLTPNETKLLAYLAARPGVVVERSALLRDVWGYNPRVESRAPDIAIRRLRVKIEVDADAPDHLLTVKGVGYRFLPADADASVRVTFARSNLSPETDRFVGRAAALEALEERLRHSALVTVLGPGGLGKTRLSRRFAARTLQSAPPAGGVWFCDLAPARDTRDLLQSVAALLDIPLRTRLPEDEQIRQLGHGLAARGGLLVVLDNLEQIIEVAAAPVAAWLAMAPEVRWVATSRHALGIDGESVLALDTLSETEALELFSERARTVRPGFAPGEDEAALSALLLERLDGLPLAIELAASRMGMLTVRQLSERLEQRWRLLATRTRIQGRHAALRATIDWSWELLSAAEQGGLAACGAFRGDFDAAAAAAVLGEGAAEVLAALERHSLVRREGARHRLLESIREYALAKLTEGDRTAEVYAAHGEHFAAFGEAMKDALRGEDARSAGRSLERCRLDLQGAWKRALGDAPARAARLALVLDAAYEREVRMAARLEVLEAALAARDALDDEQVVELLRRRADALRWTGKGDAHAVLEEAIALARASGVRAALGRALGNRAALSLNRDDFERGRQLAEEALAIHREVGARWYEGLALYHLSIAARLADAQEAMDARVQEALLVFREVGDAAMEGLLLLEQAAAASNRRDMAAAEASAREALGRGRASANALVLLDALQRLAGILIERGEVDEAEIFYQELWDWTRESGRVDLWARADQGRVTVCIERCRYDEALAILDGARVGDANRGAFLMAMHHYLRGVIYRLQGRSAEAIPELEAVLSLGPVAVTKRSVQIQMAPAMADIGRIEEAAASLDDCAAWCVATGDPVAAQQVSIGLAHVALARERAARAAGDEAAAEGWAGERAERRAAARAMADEQPDVARALRALDARLRSLASAPLPPGAG